MSDTPRTDEAQFGTGRVSVDFARTLERELNAANERIKCLIEERDRANRLADWKWNLRGEFESLLGTDNIEEGIKLVKEMKRRIKRLEEAGDAMSWTINPENWLFVDWHKAKEDKP